MNASRLDRRFLRAGLLGIAGLVAFSGAAQADYSLNFGPASSVQVAAGQTVTLSVFLTENDNNNVLANQGLVGAGVVVSFNLPIRSSDPAQVNLITPNPAVNPTDDIVSSSIVAATPTSTGTATLQFSIFDSARPPLFPTAGSNQILIGTFQFVAGTTPGEITNLSVALATPGNQFETGQGTMLDSQIVGSLGSIQVTSSAVPEPSSIALVGAGLILAGALSRRKLARPRR